jgi:glucose 1-dehydrogenase
MEKECLAGQTAIVTGSSSGIGFAIAVAMAKAGANIVVNFYHDQKGATDAKTQIEETGGKAIIVQADIGKEEDVLRMFDEARTHFGTVDILVNNAGIQKDSAFIDMTVDEWRRVMDTNLTGQFLCAREAAKEFIKHPAKPNVRSSGNIIFISSVHDIIPWAGHANYTAAKGGETMLMKTLAQELAPKRIRVNSIAPGAIKTDINKSVWSDPVQNKTLIEMIPYQRIGEPEDVAKVAVWLASDDADYITGAVIYVDGGMTLYPSFAHGG